MYSNELFPIKTELNTNTDCIHGLTSVITRTKNRPQLLKRAIQSISSQTNKQWEMIIVNDGGNPSSIDEIINRLPEETKKKIQIIHSPNSEGMEAASNKGLAKAKGEYFVIHDDDDTWSQDFLEKCTNFLAQSKNKGYVAVTTNCIVIKEKIEKNAISEVSREAWHLWNKRVSLHEILVRNTIPTITLLVRTQVLSTLEGFNQAMPVLGDWDFNIRLLTLGDIGTIEENLAYYHQRTEEHSDSSNSLTHGLELHHEIWNQYRNSLTRKALNINTESIGIINPILTKIDEFNSETNRKMELQLELTNNTYKSIASAINRLEKSLNEANQVKHEYLQREFNAIKNMIRKTTIAGIVKNCIQNIRKNVN